ncbi:MAG: glycosyltransferase [Chloroflexi bacterium]|nr:MAG: glycosyltransferase [Chloroflexota bacterium]
MQNPWDARVRRGLAALLDAEVQPAIIEPGPLESLFARAEQLPPRRPLAVGHPHRTATLLLQAGFVDPNLAFLADMDLGQVSEQTLPRLWDAMHDQLRSDAVTLDAGVPHVETLLLRPQPEGAAARSRSATDSELFPFYQDGEVLTVVVASPDAIEAARLLATARQQALRLAIAREDHLQGALLDFGTLDLRTIAPGYIEFGRLIEQQYDIERRWVITLFRRMRETSEPFDVAATRLQLLTAEQMAEALGVAIHSEALVLAREERLETVTQDGVTFTRRRLDDPVDHSIAQLLTNEESERLGALPIRREGPRGAGHTVVAMADPLDASALAALREKLGGTFEVHPATRSDILEASMRAHGRATLGDLLMEAGLITRDQLRAALEIVDRTGVRFGEALISLGAISQDELMEAIARQRGMPFFAVRGLDLDPDVLRLLPDAFARKHSMVPVMVEDDGSVTIAMEDPNDTEGMNGARELLAPRNVIFGMTTRADVRDALERVYHEAYLEHSAGSLKETSPEESAYIVVTRPQKIFLISTATVIVLALIFFTIAALTVLLALSTAFYLAFSSYKFYLIYRALSHTLEVPITDELVNALEDRDLPIYTILVPLYRETAVLPILVRGLSRMDYPKEKLDVKLLLEEDDVETIAVARLSNLPPYFDITIVPDGQPKGKPKACNYGLLHARGKYVVIFDAEDVPEPDQLKKVLVAFGMSAPNVVCIQTKLNYYNRNQNVLTKWFTTEYSTWFDLFLPGLDASGAPIPLGGTSNHFRLDALQAAGGWDPYNVTEDADLGLRIFKLGGSTAVVDSTTYEEANSVLDNWIRQRSRWVKGYIQTYLVHMRHPIKLLRSLGLGGFISFQLVIGGTFFGFLLNPLLWGLTGVWFATHWSVIQQVFPAPVYYMGAISLYVGNFAFAYMNVAGCLRRRYYSLVKWALLSPVYWVLMSIAAWKGFLQLFYRPFYWEKTIHGLAEASSIEEISKLTAEHK